MMRGQTVIPLVVSVDASLETFASQRNEELVYDLNRLLEGTREKRTIYIWGEPGAGKSHLLAVCGALWNGGSTHYVSCLQPLDPSLSDNINDGSLVCLDDIHQIVDELDAQQTILGVYEKIQSSNGSMIVTSRMPVEPMKLGLKDLASRLTIGGVFNLHSLDDGEKAELLKSQGMKRGIVLEQKVVDYIMSRYSRDVRSLFSVLDKLDSASLKEKRKITIPFVKSVLD